MPILLAVLQRAPFFGEIMLNVYEIDGDGGGMCAFYNITLLLTNDKEPSLGGGEKWEEEAEGVGDDVRNHVCI